MEGLVGLRPFVWLGQLSGFLPFRMEVEPETGKFLRFRFSFRHPLTWFYISTKIMFLLSLYWHVGSEDLPWAGASGEGMMLIRICTTFYSISLVVTELVVPLIVLRCRRLGNAVELIRTTDATLESMGAKATGGDGVIRRTWIGLLLMLFSVGTTWYQSRAENSFTSIMAAYILTSLPFYCWVLHVHLSYHILGHRIRVLRSYLSSGRSGAGVGRKLKTVEAVFSAICRCAGELNSANSAPVWIIFTTKTVNQISVLYKILDDVLVGQVDAQFWGVVICTCNEIVILVMILSAIDSPVNEVIQLRRCIMNIPKMALVSREDHLQVISCLMKICEQRVRLVAGGMFNMGIHLIPAVVGTIVTYLVALLTMK